ncbi:peptidoglycan-binding protein [Microbacterium sp. CR_7]|uniref:peptidoglycan-binding protein n=1 Tax=Microbacterium sp. CR_7 TaxID=3055792 RepID=UPI0035C14986
MIARENAARSRWVVAIAAMSIVSVIGVGFWFATQFQSAAQQEADAKAPAPGAVLAEVTQGSLAAEVGFTGEVGPSTQTPVTVVAPPDASLAVVTGRPLEVGETASSGHVLTEVNGRPLFGVHSPFAFYRDMGVGDRGPDVAALQSALAARSYPVKADGRFGSETAAAVVRWYRDDGYEAPTRVSTVAEPDGAEDDDGARDTSTPPPPTGGFVPVAEIQAMPASNAQVVQGLKVGQQLAVEGQPDFILGSADLVITITVPVSDLGEVVAGDMATISVDGGEVEGTVGDIRSPDAAETPETETPGGQAGSAESEVTFTVLPKTPLPVSTGRARVTVVKQIVAEDALIVPVLAVSDRGAHKNVLTKRQQDGTFIEVAVTVLGTLQGEVAIEPVEQGALAPGDRVRVG